MTQKWIDENSKDQVVVITNNNLLRGILVETKRDLTVVDNINYEFQLKGEINLKSVKEVRFIEEKQKITIKYNKKSIFTIEMSNRDSLKDIYFRLKDLLPAKHFHYPMTFFEKGLKTLIALGFITIIYLVLISLDFNALDATSHTSKGQTVEILFKALKSLSTFNLSILFGVFAILALSSLILKTRKQLTMNKLIVNP